MRLSQEKKKALLDGIAAAHDGVLYPEDVVRVAADPAHPLHEEFNWDDKSAAHAHRLEQARSLIRSVRVEITTQRRELSAPYYVPHPDADPRVGGYLAIPKLMSDKDRARAAIAGEFGRASAALRRARDISVAVGMDQRVDDILKVLEELAGELEPLKAVAG